MTGVISVLLRFIFPVLSGILAFTLIFPLDYNPEGFQLTPFRPLIRNHKLAPSQLVHVREFRGAEGFASNNDDSFVVSVADGRVIEVTPQSDGSLELNTLFRTGQDLPDCGNYDPAVEAQCGRPLGMEFDEDGNLWVADAWFGLLKYTTATKKLESVFKPDIPYFCNDVVLAPDGFVYMTQSFISGWTRPENRLAYSEAKKEGVLWKINPKTGDAEIVLADLIFPNGIVLSYDKQYLIFSELTLHRLIKYDFKTQETSIFYDGANTLIDNIAHYTDNKGVRGYLVTGATARKKPFSFPDFAGNYPLIRKLLYWVPDETFFKYVPIFCLVEFISEDGEQVETYQDPTSQVKGASEAYAFGDYLYIGSYKFPLRRVPLSQIQE